MSKYLFFVGCDMDDYNKPVTFIESHFNVDEMQRHEVERKLSDVHIDNSLKDIINSLTLRARFNPQRHYKFFLITVDDSMDGYIEEMVKNNQQPLIDTLIESESEICL